MLLAQEAADGGSALGSLLFLALLVVGMYLLLIRPQRKRARQLAEVRENLQVGRRVMTTAGLHATVVDLPGDGTVVLEIAPGVHSVFATAAVVAVLDKPEPAEVEPPGDEQA